jgi:hypothetical protein
MPRQPPITERGDWIAWRGRGYWLRQEAERVVLYAPGRQAPSYELRGIGVTPAYDFGAFSLRTGKRVGGVFHRYLVQRNGPQRFPKVPRWFSPDHWD